MPPSARIPVECLTCGKTFLVYRYDREIRFRKYCSVSCQGASARLPVPARSELYRLYHAESFSTNDLARHYGVSKGLIYNWMKALDIPTRGASEAISIAQTGKPAPESRKSAIGRAHKGRAHPWQVGRLNPIYKNSTSGMHYSKSGKRDDIGIYVRSSWEANFCRLLNLRKAKGEILEWEYEPTTFVFHGVTRGAVSYLPDFRITHLDGSIEYIEIKGRETSRDRTKWARLRKYYPTVCLTVLGAADYRRLQGQVASLIPMWEF